jgi:hypothetical protein
MFGPSWKPPSSHKNSIFSSVEESSSWALGYRFSITLGDTAGICYVSKYLLNTLSFLTGQTSISILSRTPDQRPVMGRELIQGDIEYAQILLQAHRGDSEIIKALAHRGLVEGTAV